MTDLFEPLPTSAGTRRKENTRQRLVQASLDVFVDKGVDGVTVDDIVKAAGFTRGAFYSNFSNKEEVFLALFSSVTDELLTILRTEVEGAIPVTAPDPCLREDPDAAVLVAAFEALRPYSRQWYLLYTDAVTHSLREAEMRAALTSELGRLRDAVARLLARGMEQNGERSRLPLPDLAQLLVGIFLDLMLRELLDGREDVTELAATTILGTLHAFLEPA